MEGDSIETVILEVANDHIRKCINVICLSVQRTPRRFDVIAVLLLQPALIDLVEQNFTLIHMVHSGGDKPLSHVIHEPPDAIILKQMYVIRITHYPNVICKNE